MSLSWEEVRSKAAILIIDDEEAKLRMLDRMFRKAGYRHVSVISVR